MKKAIRLEQKILDEIRNYLHANMLNSQEDEAKLIYEFCYLRLFSLEIFKQIFSNNSRITLKEFINDYKKHVGITIQEKLNFDNELGKEIIKITKRQIKHKI